MARLGARSIAVRSAPWLLLLVLVPVLAACSVSLIQPYDEVTERTVSDFYEDFIRFTIVTGRSRGTFADNRTFYDAWQPKLTTLTARALVANPTGKCPSSETYGGLLPQGVAGARGTTTAGARTGTPVAGARDAEAPAGDCTAQLLQLLEDQFADFAKFHEAQGALGLPPEALAPRELVLTSARAVLYVELTRKKGQ